MCIQTNKEVLTQSGGAWRASRLQRSSATSSSCQDEVAAAGGWRNGVVGRILGGLLRFFRRAGLFEVHAVQGLIAVPRVEKHVGLGTLCNGSSALAELGFIETCQSALAKVLQLVQANAWIPGEHEFQSLLSASPSHGLFLDIDSVGHKRDPLEERLDLIRHRSPRPQSFKDRNNGSAEIPAQLSDWVKPAFNQCHQFP
jgi:hypothetical protein